MKIYEFKKVISTFLVLVFLFISVSAVFILLNNSEAEAETGPKSETIEILNNVNNDFTFAIVSDNQISDANLNKFVTVKDTQGKIQDIEVHKKGENYIVSSKDPYKEGECYTINLKNAKFQDERFNETLAFSVKSPVKEDIDYQSSVKKLDIKEGDGIEIDETEKKIYLNSADQSIQIGDILLIPTLIPDSEFYVEVAYKVDSMEGNEINFSVPEFDEVYSKFDVSNIYQPQDYRVYDNIKEQVKNNSQIMAISKALYDIQNYREDLNGGIVKNNISLTPDSIDIDFKGFNPVDVEIIVKWKIKSDISFKLSLKYTATTTASYTGSSGQQRQTTSQTGRWEVGVALEYSKSVNVQKIFDEVTYRDKYAENLYSGYNIDKELSEAEKKLKDTSLSEAERAEWQQKKAQAQSKAAFNDLQKKRLEAIDKRAAMLALDSLANYYKNETNSSKSVIKLVQFFIPVAPSVAFVVDCGGVLDFSLSAAAEMKVIIDSTNEVTTVTSENSESDYTNTYTEVSGYAGIVGTFTFKIGVQLGVGVTVAGIFNLDLTFEGGAYFKLNAMGIICFGDVDSLDLSEEEREIASGCTEIGDGKVKLYGSVSYDIGVYITAESTVGFDLWILEITKTFSIADKEWPLILYEDEQHNYSYDLVFAQDTGIKNIDAIIAQLDSVIEKGDSYDPTRTFVFENDESIITIPDIYIRTIDLTTGEITYEIVDESELIFINQEQVYNIGYEIYQNDRQMPAIDNRLNIRVDSMNEEIAQLYLPVRVIKEPIPVESLALSAGDNSNTIGLTESKYLNVEIYPDNASYKNYDYKIDKIVKPDGTVYQGDLDLYAYIDNGELFTTEDIAIGSQIYITAETLPNNIIETTVQSNILIIEVTRIGITEIIFSDPYRRGDINLGETLSLSVRVYPENATINILRDSPITVSLNDDSIATLEKTDDWNYTLTASDDLNNLNKDIKLTLTTESYAKTYTYRIGSVPIQSMDIYNETTGEELESEIELYRLSTLNLETVITPVNASVDAVSYNLYSETPNIGYYITVSEDGTLTVSDIAPFDLVVYLSATAMNSTTQSYKITIIRVPAESVLIMADTSYIEQGTVVHFNAVINPEYADIVTIQYELVENIAGVLISSNMVYATSTVAIGTEIKVRAIVDGVASNVFSLYVTGDLDAPIIPAEGEPSGEEFIYSSDSDIDGDVHSQAA